MLGITKKFRTVTVAALAAVSLFAMATTAQATLSLKINGTQVDDGSASDSNPAAGAITYIGFLGLGTMTVDTGVSKPNIGSAAAPELHLDGLLTSIGPMSLTLMLSDTDFSGTLGDFFATIGGILNGGAGSNITYSVYRDLNNTLFGTGAGTLVCTVGTLTTSPINGACSDTATLDSAYSITLVATLNHTGVGHSSFNAIAKDDARVPEPSAMILFGMGLIGLAAWRRRQEMGTLNS